MPNNRYRVYSRIPLARPRMAIGQAAPTLGGYREAYSRTVTSRRKAKQLLRQAREAEPFGQHALELVPDGE